MNSDHTYRPPSDPHTIRRERFTGIAIVLAIVLLVWLTLPWTFGVQRSITFDQPAAATHPAGYWFVICIDPRCETRYASELTHDHNGTFTAPALLKPGQHTVRIKVCAPLTGCSPESWQVVEVAADWTWRGWR